jgi:hypothetical protein
MSAYREQKTSINDAECLMIALQGMGFTPQRHAVAVPLTGYTGDKRKQTAEIVIPRKQVGGASNDIGFKKAVNGSFNAIISDYDSHRHGEAWLKDVKMRALEAKAMKIAKAQGDLGACTRTVLQNGKIRLQFVKRG